MSDYVFSLFQRLAGGGLIANDPLVTDTTDFGGTPYVEEDYEGSYLVDVQLKDVPAFLRVKKWSVTVTVDVTFGATSTTYTSSTITTPETVYELAWGSFSESAPTAVDWTTSSLHEVPDENYHELKKGTGTRDSRPFKELKVVGEVATDQGWGLTIQPAKGYQSFDYYIQTLPNLEAAFSVKPTDPIYLPVGVRLDYGDSTGTFPDPIAVQVFSKISDSNLDWNKADLTKVEDAISLTYVGVDTTFDAYWGELNGETITLDNLSIDIEAAEYWSYGGKFNTTTGQPI